MILKIISIVLLVTSFFQCNINGQDLLSKPNKKLIKRISSTHGLIALWKFDEQPGNARIADGKDKFPLEEANGKILRINEGPVSGYSIMLDGTNYLNLSNSKVGDLNIYGDGKEVTVIAWLKWTGEQTGFVGGMWNEYKDGGKRQYGLFISLPYYNGKDQVCGHISKPVSPRLHFRIL